MSFCACFLGFSEICRILLISKIATKTQHFTQHSAAASREISESFTGSLRLVDNLLKLLVDDDVLPLVAVHVALLPTWVGG